MKKNIEMLIIMFCFFSFIFGIFTVKTSAQTCQPAPVGMVSWWQAENNALDSRSSNFGTLENGAGFAPGQVGQTFNFDGFDDQFTVPHNDNQGIASAFSAEAWVFPRTLPNVSPRIFDKDGEFGIRWLMAINNFPGNIQAVSVNINSNDAVTPPNAVPLNQWSHIAFTYETANLLIYINGVESANSNIGSLTANPNAPLVIGNDSFVNTPGDVNARDFDGLIDEPAIYNRALSQTEIQAIFNAGPAGKLKTAATPTGFSMADLKNFSAELSPQTVNVTVGDATITFPTVSAAGITQQIPLDPSLLPSLPVGSTSVGLIYDIATNATFTGSPQVCFNLPSITNSTDFNNLRILHLENNVWTNRTAVASINFPASVICTSGLTSLSPFAVVNGFTTTAASVSVSGRLFDADGRAVYRARVLITDANGTTSTTLTNPFGHFQFSDIQVGEIYVINVFSKQFQFQPQIISVADEVTDLNITALP